MEANTEKTETGRGRELAPRVPGSPTFLRVPEISHQQKERAGDSLAMVFSRVTQRPVSLKGPGKPHPGRLTT